MVVRWIETLRGFNSNIYLIDSDRPYLVDTGCGADTPHVIEQISDYLRGRPLQAILLTHCHADHAGGAAEVSKAFKCPVFLGARDIPAFESGDASATFADGIGVELRPVKCCPLHEGDVFDAGECRLRAVETPGHTPGSVCFYDELSHALFSGDTVFAQGFGRTDLPGGSMDEMRQSLGILRNFEIEHLYPGHGAEASDGNKAVEAAVMMTEGWY